jgi:alpha-galactosidase
MADAMVSTGLAKAGYQYINVDAGYLTHTRDSTGKLVVNKEKFPSGMRALADHIHSRGLKLGV